MPMNIEQTRILSEEDFDGTKPAPLLLYGPERNAEQVAKQDKLADNFALAARQFLTGIVSDEAIDFTGDNIINRMQQREGRNSMAYLYRNNVYPDYETCSDHSVDEIDLAHESMRVGNASLSQLYLAGKALDMYAWEGRNLTMINSFRRDLEAGMWDEVSEFTGVNAHPRFEQMRKFKVHEFLGGTHHNDSIKAMRIETKRTIKQYEDGSALKARTFATINTSRDVGFRQEEIRNIHAEQRRNGPNLSNYAPLLKIIERLVNDELPEGVALARNETVYYFNPHAAKRHEESRET